MNHLWRGKVLIIHGPVLNYVGGGREGRAAIGGAHFIPLPSPTKPDAPFMTLAYPMPGLVKTP